MQALLLLVTIGLPFFLVLLTIIWFLGQYLAGRDFFTFTRYAKAEGDSAIAEYTLKEFEWDLMADQYDAQWNKHIRHRESAEGSVPNSLAYKEGLFQEYLDQYALTQAHH